MTITIRQKLYGLGLLGVVFSVAVGVSGWKGIRDVARGVKDVAATSTAIRSHYGSEHVLGSDASGHLENADRFW